MDTNNVGFEACAASTATGFANRLGYGDAITNSHRYTNRHSDGDGHPTGSLRLYADATPTTDAHAYAHAVAQTPTPHVTPASLPRTGGPSLESGGSWWALCWSPWSWAASAPWCWS